MIQMLHMVSLEKNFITSKIVGPHYKNAFIPVMVPAHNMRTKKILLIFGNICQTFNLVLESNFLAMLHGSSGDSIQGTFKYLVAHASLWSLKKPFDTPEKMFL